MVEDADRFPFNVPAIEKLGELEFHPAVTFFVGENGSGKSTLLEAMAVRMDLDETGGNVGAGFQRRAFDGGLHDAIRIRQSPYHRPADRFFLRAETVYNFATQLDKDAREDPEILASYGFKSLHARSHGEMFLAIVQNRMKRDSFFILDEPEAALSPARQLTAIKEIDWLVREGCQFVIATHSPILLSYPDSWIYQLGPDGFTRAEYEDTEHFTLTRDFLNHREAYLRHLVE